jgi:hypothetical protein
LGQSRNHLNLTNSAENFYTAQPLTTVAVFSGEPIDLAQTPQAALHKLDKP